MNSVTNPEPALSFESDAAWAAWLAANHTRTTGVWLVTWRVQSGRPSLGYEDSVIEALRFGWIDSIIQKIDEERYARLLGSVPAVVSGLLMTKGSLLGHGALRMHHLFVWPAFALLVGLAVWRVSAGARGGPMPLAGRPLVASGALFRSFRESSRCVQLSIPPVASRPARS